MAAIEKRPLASLKSVEAPSPLVVYATDTLIIGGLFEKRLKDYCVLLARAAFFIMFWFQVLIPTSSIHKWTFQSKSQMTLAGNLLIMSLTETQNLKIT